MILYFEPGVQPMPLRKNADWMGVDDDRILEVMDILQEGVTAKEIRDELAERGTDLDHREMYVEIRCDFLADAGLLAFDFDTETFKLTDNGREYLAGEFDVGELELERPYQDTRNIDFVI